MASSKVVPLLALLLGTVGLLFSVVPLESLGLGDWLHKSPYSFLTRGNCPLSILSLRAALYSYMTGQSITFGSCGHYPASLVMNDTTGLPIWDAATLIKYGGCDKLPESGCVLLAVNNFVYDVTDLGMKFYGPKAGYCMFSGRDATRSLVLGSLDNEDLERGGDVSDLSPDTIQEQHKFYSDKYGPAIGHCCEVKPWMPTPVVEEAALGVVEKKVVEEEEEEEEEKQAVDL